MNILPSKNSCFTLAEYRRLLCLTSAQFPIVGFEVLDSVPHSSARFAIIRHDIDISPTQALAIATIEAEMGVKSTYTILLTGDFYSPFEKSTCELLKKISFLGHDLGLHFDPAWHGIKKEEELTEAIKWEAGVLNRLLELPNERQVKMFSFHNTTPFTMSCKASHYAGLRNAYASYLQNHLEYTSDSNGYWIHRSWQELLDQQHNKIQVLTHPEWWTATGAHPAEKVCRNLASRSRSTWVSYRTLLQEGNRENLTGLSSSPSTLAALFQEEGDRLLMLWLEGCRSEAFVELFCRFEKQCRQILRKHFRVNMKTISMPVQALLSDYRLQLDPLLALAVVSNTTVEQLLGFSIQTYRKAKNHRNMLVHGYGSVSSVELSGSFNSLIHAVVRLADKGVVLVGTTGTQKLTTKGMPQKGDAETLIKWLELNHQRLDLSLNAIYKFSQRLRSIIQNSGKP